MKFTPGQWAGCCVLGLVFWFYAKHDAYRSWADPLIDLVASFIAAAILIWLVNLVIYVVKSIRKKLQRSGN